MSDRIKRQFNRLTAGMRNVWVYLGAAIAVSALFAFALPGPIANNTFLRNFLPSEYLPTLIVLVTVTLASIVNIHVKLTIMMDGDDLGTFEESEIDKLRGKTNDIARFFLVIPVAAVFMLIYDGTLPTGSLGRAWTFSGLLALFFAATAATYEVQRIVIELSELPDRH